jgi:hypothetical protein
MDKLTFSERREQMLRLSSGIAEISRTLKVYAETLYAEAEHMAAAEKRFTERRGRTTHKASR